MHPSPPTPRPAARATTGHPPEARLAWRRDSHAAPEQGRTGSATGWARLATVWWLLLAAVVTAPAQAGGPAAPARPSAWQAEASVPALRHESAFSTYRPHVETPVGDWRAANEAVNRIGGWRAYGREAGAPLQPLPPPQRDGARPAGNTTPAGRSADDGADARPAASSTPPGTAAPAGHGAHHLPGGSR
jgi:hypothetical protein